MRNNMTVHLHGIGRSWMPRDRDTSIKELYDLDRVHCTAYMSCDNYTVSLCRYMYMYR